MTNKFTCLLPGCRTAGPPPADSPGFIASKIPRLFGKGFSEWTMREIRKTAHIYLPIPCRYRFTTPKTTY
jgi:hypothetical protein